MSLFIDPVVEEYEDAHGEGNRDAIPRDSNRVLTA